MNAFIVENLKQLYRAKSALKSLDNQHRNCNQHSKLKNNISNGLQ